MTVVKKLFALLLATAMTLTLFACVKTDEPTASSSELGGPKLYFLTDSGEGQMYYNVLELHPEAEFDGADKPMDEKYVGYLWRCQLTQDDFGEWTNGDAEEFLRGKTYRFEREYTEEQVAKFNELGLTVNKLHTLLNASFDIEDIMELTADRVKELFEKGEWDGV